MVIVQPYMSEALGSSSNHGAKSVGGVFIIWGAYEAEILVLGGEGPLFHDIKQV